MDSARREIGKKYASAIPTPSTKTTSIHKTPEMHLVHIVLMYTECSRQLAALLERAYGGMSWALYPSLRRLVLLF